jgi:hypothetical protein
VNVTNRHLMLVAPLIVAVGFLIRLPHLEDPPLRFHPTRQYRSAIIARGFYAPRMTHLSPQESAAIREAARRMPAIEPPVMEHVAAWAYRLLGREDLRLPRLISILAEAGRAALLCRGR